MINDTRKTTLNEKQHRFLQVSLLSKIFFYSLYCLSYFNIIFSSIIISDEKKISKQLKGTTQTANILLISATYMFGFSEIYVKQISLSHLTYLCQDFTPRL